MRCRKVGKAKEKASKNSIRRCFQNTGSRSVYSATTTSQRHSHALRSHSSHQQVVPEHHTGNAVLGALQGLIQTVWQDS